MRAAPGSFINEIARTNRRVILAGRPHDPSSATAHTTPRCLRAPNSWTALDLEEIGDGIGLNVETEMLGSPRLHQRVPKGSSCRLRRYGRRRAQTCEWRPHKDSSGSLTIPDWHHCSVPSRHSGFVETLGFKKKWCQTLLASLEICGSALRHIVLATNGVSRDSAPAQSASACVARSQELTISSISIDHLIKAE